MWGGTERKNREEGGRAWKVSIEEIKARGYNLDIKNPHTVEDDLGDPDTLLEKLTRAEFEVSSARTQLKRTLSGAVIAVNGDRILAMYDRVG